MPDPSTFAIIPREMLLVLIAVPVSAAVGFALGLLYERWYHFSAIQKLSKRFEKLFDSVSQSLDKAERACRIYNQHPQSQRLSSRQRQEMEKLTDRLTSGINSIADSCARQSLQEKADRTKQSANSVKRKLKSFQQPDWKLEPVDERTDLPDATAYQANLQQLLAAMQQTDCKSAVLFIKLDHYTRHAKQFGGKTADAFLKKTGSVVLRKLRQDDFITQVTEDLLIAVLPNIQSGELQKLASNARNAVRTHRYINPESDQEVFVTASFSYTKFDETLEKNKTPDQELWDRCQNALAASQKQGRCQLHEMTDLGISRLIAG